MVGEKHASSMLTRLYVLEYATARGKCMQCFCYMYIGVAASKRMDHAATLSALCARAMVYRCWGRARANSATQICDEI